MSKHKIQRFISIMLCLAITGTMIPCSAANLVPFNAVKPVVTPSAPVTKYIVESKPSSDGFSMESIESKVNDIANFQKSKTKFQATHSGTLGDNLTWELDTSKGVLTISGTGEMDNCGWDGGAPWYSYRSSIKTVTIGNGVTSISSYAFSKCSALNCVNIPNSVTSIEESAFADCRGLTSVVIPASVIRIADSTFKFCDELTSVTVSSPCLYIGEDAFYKCDRLNFKEYDNALYLGNESNPYHALIKIKNKGITSAVQVNENTKAIARCAFKESHVTSVTIGCSIAYIANYAFEDCSELESVNFFGSRDDVTEYSEFVRFSLFYNCPKLSKVNVPTNYKGEKFSDLPVEKTLTPMESCSTSKTGCIWMKDTSTDSSTSKESKNPKISTEALVGIIAGGVAAVVAGVVGTMLCLKHRHAQIVPV